MNRVSPIFVRVHLCNYSIRVGEAAVFLFSDFKNSFYKGDLG